MDHANEPDPASLPTLGLHAAVLDDDAVDALLERVVKLARMTVGGARSVSLTVVENGEYRTCNSTDDDARAIDEAQYRGRQGPCLEAIRTARQLQVSVDAEQARWPLFARRAREVGVAAALCIPLVRAPGESLGALNIYAAQGGRFAEQDVRTAELIGEHASILVGCTLALLSATQLNEQLREAVTSREVIGEAKGILMEREGCRRAEAIDILRRASQRENRKLRDLAEELVLRVEGRAREDRPGP